MTAESFPYFTSLHVNDCFTYRDFDIPIGAGDDKPFRHLILTGRNGSGKTTILKGIDEWAENVLELSNSEYPVSLFEMILGVKEDNTWIKERLKILPTPYFDQALYKGAFRFVYKYFQARRVIEFDKVVTVTPETEIIKNINRPQKSFSELLNQLLVNKKVNEAFAIIEKNGRIAEEQGRFFEELEQVLSKVFDDPKLKLIFVREDYEFYIKLSDGLQITFNQLSDGFSAFIGIVLELLIRVDIIQQNQKNFTLDPPGIVLIDEPETHLHLEMQYQVMPLLTRLFPNIQFIIATHSPAVVSSIKNATVFDLTTKEVAKDWVVGSSFSELMQVHFGLDNEFSNIADDIMAASQKIVDSTKNPEEKLTALKTLFKKNERYLSPAFHLAIESQILRLEKALKPV